MKKYIIAIVCIVFVFAGVTLGLVLTEEQEEDFTLTLRAENIELFVGETDKLIYSCSINGIPVVKRIANSKIATIEDEYVTAKKVGETELTLEAKYKGERVEKIIVITVLEEPEEPETPPPSQEQNQNGDTSDNEEENTLTPEEPEEQEPVVEKPVILFEETNLSNCTVQNNIITIQEDVVGRFSVYLQNNVSCIITVTSESEHVEVTKITSMSGNFYKIKGTAVGEYEICMSTNGSEVVKFTVKVV